MIFFLNENEKSVFSSQGSLSFLLIMQWYRVLRKSEPRPLVVNPRKEAAQGKLRAGTLQWSISESRRKLGVNFPKEALKLPPLFWILNPHIVFPRKRRPFL